MMEISGEDWGSFGCGLFWCWDLFLSSSRFSFFFLFFFCVHIIVLKVLQPIFIFFFCGFWYSFLHLCSLCISIVKQDRVGFLSSGIGHGTHVQSWKRVAYPTRPVDTSHWTEAKSNKIYLWIIDPNTSMNVYKPWILPIEYKEIIVSFFFCSWPWYPSILKSPSIFWIFFGWWIL